MSAPRDIEPHTPGTGDEDQDPTGVRALLASLPDPGPMPPELVRRISESLAAEQDGPVRHGNRSIGYAPVTDRAHGAAPEGQGDQRPDGDGGPEDGGTIHHLPRRGADEPAGHRPLRRLPAIAIAASFVVLAGAVILGVLTTQTGLGGSDSLDAAVQATMSGAEAGSQGDEAGGAAEDSSAESGAAESAPTSSPLGDDAAVMVATPVAFLSTGAVVTSANLAGHAKAIRDGSAGVTDQSSRTVMSQSPVGTPEGAADCVGDLLDRPAVEVAGLLAAVDFVRYDEAAAALILVRDPLDGTTGSGPAGSDTKDDRAAPAQVGTAYLVPVDCGPGRAWTLQAPVRVDF